MTRRGGKQKKRGGLVDLKEEPLLGPRKWNLLVDECDSKSSAPALPILSAKGTWKKTVKRLKVQEEEVKDEIPPNDKPIMDEIPPNDIINVETEENHIAKSFEEARLEIAAIAIEITEDPEGGLLHLSQILKKLRPFLSHPDASICQTALGTLFAIVKDLLPAYPIVKREAEEEEKKESKNLLSKEVKAMRRQDLSILAAYEDLLGRLENIDCPVAVPCLVELGLVAAHFNHYERVIDALVKAAFSPMNIAAMAGIGRIFKEDSQGKATWLILRKASELIKQRSYRAPLPFMTVIVDCLRINTEVSIDRKVQISHPTRKHLSKRDRKERKERLAVAQRQAEAEISANLSDRRRWAGESRRHLLRILFGILLSNGHSKGRDLNGKGRDQSLLLLTVLQALSKFAHLIGPEHLPDLLTRLKGLLHRDVDPTVGLQSLLTVAQLQSTVESLGTMDLAFLHRYLFELLAVSDEKLFAETDQKQVIDLLRRSFALSLGPKRLVPHVRLAAFAQRLADRIAASLPNDPSLAALALELLEGLFRDRPKLHSLLDQETFGQGSYRPDCPDPDLANPFSRSLPLPPNVQDPTCRGIIGRIRKLALIN